MEQLRRKITQLNNIGSEHFKWGLIEEIFDAVKGEIYPITESHHDEEARNGMCNATQFLNTGLIPHTCALFIYVHSSLHVFCLRC